MKLYTFRTVRLSIISSLITVHSAMLYVIQTAFEQKHMLLLECCLQTYMTYNIAQCTVNKRLIMDRRTVRNRYSYMPK